MSEVAPIKLPPIDLGIGGLEALRERLADPELQAELQRAVQVEFTRVLETAPANVAATLTPASLVDPAMLAVYTLWAASAWFAWSRRADPRAQLLIVATVAVLFYGCGDALNAALNLATTPFSARRHFDGDGLFFLIWISLPSFVLAGLCAVNIAVRVCANRFCGARAKPAPAAPSIAPLVGQPVREPRTQTKHD